MTTIELLTLINRRNKEERIKMVQLFYKFGSYQGVIENWPDNNPPDRKTIIRTKQHFEEEGSINDKQHTGRKRRKLDEEGLKKIENSIKENPKLSERKRSEFLIMGKSTIHRGIHELCYKPYRMQRIFLIKQMTNQKELNFAIK